MSSQAVVGGLVVVVGLQLAAWNETALAPPAVAAGMMMMTIMKSFVGLATMQLIYSLTVLLQVPISSSLPLPAEYVVHWSHV